MCVHTQICRRTIILPVFDKIPYSAVQEQSPNPTVTVWNTFYISVPKERVLSSGWEGEEHGRVLVDVQRAQQ